MLTKEYVVSFDTYLNEGYEPGKSKSKKSMKDTEEDEDEDDSEDEDEDEDTNEAFKPKHKKGKKVAPKHEDDEEDMSHDEKEGKKETDKVVENFIDACETIVESTVEAINKIHYDFVNENEYEFSTLSESVMMSVKPMLEMVLRANTIEELEEVSESIEEYSDLNEAEGDPKKESWMKKLGKMISDKTKAMKASLSKLTAKKKKSEADIKASTASPEEKKAKMKKLAEWFKKAWDAIKSGVGKAIAAIKNKFKKKK